MSLIKQQILNKDMYKYKCPYPMNPIGLCIHNTDNDASAKNEIINMTKEENKKKISFHLAVDDKEALQGIPFDRNAFAAGDGKNGAGNRKFIHLEICYSASGGTRFTEAENRAVKVAAEICRMYNWDISHIEPHRAFSGKNCPARTSIDQFKRRVQAELKGSDKPAVDFKNGDYSGKKARVTASVLNIRWDRGANFEIVGKLKKGDIIKLQYCLNGWISIEGYKGNKGFGYVSTNYLELI